MDACHRQRLVSGCLQEKGRDEASLEKTISKKLTIKSNEVRYLCGGNCSGGGLFRQKITKKGGVIMISFYVNGKKQTVDVSPDTPLLWVIRDQLKLTGTKYGCGIGECGSCTVHIDGKAYRSCVTPVGQVQGKRVTTIEGLPKNNPVKKAWIQEQVPQCGYCQTGVIMQVAALISESKNPDTDKIVNAMDDVLCRCGSYPRMKKGIKAAVEIARKEGKAS